MSVPTPSNVQFGTVDPNTGTWEYTDKSLGAGVEVGPNGAALLSRSPTAVRCMLAFPTKRAFALCCLN